MAGGEGVERFLGVGVALPRPGRANCTCPSRADAIARTDGPPLLHAPARPTHRPASRPTDRANKFRGTFKCRRQTSERRTDRQEAQQVRR